jgi:hypothetical protein
MVMARRDLLEYLQARLLEELGLETVTEDRSAERSSPGVHGKDLAPLAKELRAVTAELETLPTGEVSTVDDLAKRRADRRSAASG